MALFAKIVFWFIARKFTVIPGTVCIHISPEPSPLSNFNQSMTGYVTPAWC